VFTLIRLGLYWFCESCYTIADIWTTVFSIFKFFFSAWKYFNSSQTSRVCDYLMYGLWPSSHIKRNNKHQSITFVSKKGSVHVLKLTWWIPTNFGTINRSREGFARWAYLSRFPPNMGDILSTKHCVLIILGACT
jgi:hypothetical protein